jgi:hypothetical protein
MCNISRHIKNAGMLMGIFEHLTTKDRSMASETGLGRATSTSCESP